jgi:hypothetical protein
MKTPLYSSKVDFCPSPFLLLGYFMRLFYSCDRIWLLEDWGRPMTDLSYDSWILIIIFVTLLNSWSSPPLLHCSQSWSHPLEVDILNMIFVMPTTSLLRGSCYLHLMDKKSCLKSVIQLPKDPWLQSRVWSQGHLVLKTISRFPPPLCDFQGTAWEAPSQALVSLWTTRDSLTSSWLCAEVSSSWHWSWNS